MDIKKGVFKKQKGFTLLETLVAVSLLSVAILGPFTLAIQSISSAERSKNQIIAFNLAQEGMELVRNKRSANVFQGLGWLNDLSTNCQSSNGCIIDAFSSTITQCTSSCPVLKYNQTTGTYGYQSGGDTIFVRKIKLINVPGPNAEIQIESEVSWQDRFGNPSIVLETYLFDWH